MVRLSSLGDLILATSVLEVLPREDRCDWLTAQEYRGLLVDHPKISQVLEFEVE